MHATSNAAAQGASNATAEKETSVTKLVAEKSSISATPKAAVQRSNKNKTEGSTARSAGSHHRRTNIIYPSQHSAVSNQLVPLTIPNDSQDELCDTKGDDVEKHFAYPFVAGDG